MHGNAILTVAQCDQMVRFQSHAAAQSSQRYNKYDQCEGEEHPARPSVLHPAYVCGF